MRSYCAIYVDVGYLLAAAATRVTGTSLRRGVRVDHPELIRALMDKAEEDCGLPLLRVNWYDSGARPGGMPDYIQDEIGLLPRVKLRLGRLSHAGEQKGVDLRIGLDLATHGRNRVVDVIYLVSGDDDLTEAVEEAQGHGVQVILLAVPGQDGRPHGVARHLQRAADGLVLLDGATIDQVVRSSAIPEPLIPDEFKPEDEIDTAQVAADAGVDAAALEPVLDRDDAAADDDSTAASTAPASVGGSAEEAAHSPAAAGSSDDDVAHPAGAPAAARTGAAANNGAAARNGTAARTKAAAGNGAAAAAGNESHGDGRHTEGQRTESRQTESRQTESRQTEGRQTEGRQTEGRQTEPALTDSTSAPHLPGPSPSLFAKKKATTLVPPPEPVWSTATGEPPYGSYVEVSPELITTVARQVVRSWCATATPEDLATLKAQRPSIPPDLDRALLMDLSNRSEQYDIDEVSRHDLRNRFWQMLDQVKLT